MRDRSEPSTDYPYTDLRSALEASSRNVRDENGRRETILDPIACAVLRSHDFAALEARLVQAGITGFRPLSGGSASVVLDCGDHVLRVGVRGDMRLSDRPPLPELLQSRERGMLATLAFEVLPKVETRGITRDDVAAMEEALAGKGLRMRKPLPENLGRLEGRLVVIDPDAIGPGRIRDFTRATARSARVESERAEPVQPRVSEALHETNAPREAKAPRAGAFVGGFPFSASSEAAARPTTHARSSEGSFAPGLFGRGARPLEAQDHDPDRRARMTRELVERYVLAKKNAEPARTRSHGLDRSL